MIKQKVFAVTIVIALFCTLSAFAKVVVLFDEDAKDEGGNGNFPGVFVSHDAGSVVEVSSDDAIAGKVSAFCTPSQSYNPNIAGWSYPVDDYPYITFAWKKVGGTGIMIQFAHDGGWAYRYFSGVNVTNWPGIQLEKDIPEDWMVYTRRWVDDFGGGWKLTGLALTPWNGEGGYYDHILIHTEENEGQIEPQAVQPEDKLAVVWADLRR